MGKNHYVIRCKKCGMRSVKEIRISLVKATFHCKFCNSRFKLKKANQFGLALKVIGAYNCFEATDVCKRLNQLSWRGKDVLEKKEKKDC